MPKPVGGSSYQQAYGSGYNLQGRRQGSGGSLGSDAQPAPVQAKSAMSQVVTAGGSPNDIRGAADVVQSLIQQQQNANSPPLNLLPSASSGGNAGRGGFGKTSSSGSMSSRGNGVAYGGGGGYQAKAKSINKSRQVPGGGRFGCAAPFSYAEQREAERSQRSSDKSEVSALKKQNLLEQNVPLSQIYLQSRDQRVDAASTRSGARPKS